MIPPIFKQKALALRLGRDLGKKTYSMLFNKWTPQAKVRSKEDVFRMWHTRSRRILNFNTPTQYIDHQ